MVARQSDKCRSIFRLSPILYGKKHMGLATRASRDSRATHVLGLHVLVVRIVHVVSRRGSLERGQRVGEL